MAGITPQEEIETLLARVDLGDRQAFQDLYARTSAKLFGICLRVLTDKDEAEDVLQEVYIRIWHKAGLYQSNGYSPMTWLITIARNLSIDRLRKRPKNQTGDDALDFAPDPRPNPEATLVAASESRKLSGCLGELQPTHAEMIRRAYLDGDSYAHLADAFGVKLNTVRTWLRRGLMAVRECLER